MKISVDLAKEDDTLTVGELRQRYENKMRKRKQTMLLKNTEEST